MDYFSGYIHCPAESGGNLDCLGVSFTYLSINTYFRQSDIYIHSRSTLKLISVFFYAIKQVSSVYRISFALSLMYFIILLFVWARNECSKMFNEGLWVLKFLFVCAIFIVFMYVDYSFFDGYRDFARIFGALFLVIQSVMLIDIFYFWGERWKASYDDGATWMAYTLIITSVILYGLAITLIVLNFIWFNGCGMNTFINVTNLVLCIVVTVVQVLGFNPKGSLITSGSISLYMTFLTFSAMLSGDISCNLAMTTENIFTIELVVGLILLLVVLIYLTFASKKTSTKTLQVAQGVELNAAIIADEEHVDEDDDEHDDDDEEHSINKKKKEEKQAEEAAKAKVNAAANGELTKEEREREKWLNCDKSMRPYVYTNKYIIFHIVMLTSSVYGCMLLTNWGNPDMSSSTFNMY